MEVSSYDHGAATRESVIAGFQRVYFDQMRIVTDRAQFVTKKLVTIKIDPSKYNGQHLAFRVSIVSDPDNTRGEVPLLKDFYLEGFCLMEETKAPIRKKESSCVIF